MAVDWAVLNKRNSTYEFSPQDIEIRPDRNGRVEHVDVDDLIQGFAELGQLTPVTIGNNGKRPYLIFGHRRWRAAVEGIKSGKLPKEFKLRCEYFKGTPLDELKAVIAENRARKGNTPLDDAGNIARCERFGMSHEEIADFYGQRTVDGKPDAAWVKRTLALIGLTEESVAAVKAGKVKPNAIQALAKMSKEQQAKATRAEVVTVAACKAASNGTGPAKKDRPSLASVRNTLERIASGDAPQALVARLAIVKKEGINDCDGHNIAACNRYGYALSRWLLDYIDGEVE